MISFSISRVRFDEERGLSLICWGREYAFGEDILGMSSLSRSSRLVGRRVSRMSSKFREAVDYIEYSEKMEKNGEKETCRVLLK